MSFDAPRLIRIVTAGTVGVVLQGCVVGSLATNTGPSDVGEWSAARVQQAHVGERVGFSFILREPGSAQAVSASRLADYLVMQFGGERAEFNLGLADRFEFEHVLTQAQPGDRILVRGEAMRIRAERDTMKVGGRWQRSESPFNDPDRAVARDELTLEMYQSRVEIAFAVPPEDLDWSTARLDIVRRGNQRTAVYRASTTRHGFSVNGPGARRGGSRDIRADCRSSQSARVDHRAAHGPRCKRSHARAFYDLRDAVSPIRRRNG